jgi:hypothetical protein
MAEMEATEQMEAEAVTAGEVETEQIEQLVSFRLIQVDGLVMVDMAEMEDGEVTVAMVETVNTQCQLTQVWD